MLHVMFITVCTYALAYSGNNFINTVVIKSIIGDTITVRTYVLVLGLQFYKLYF